MHSTHVLLVCTWCIWGVAGSTTVLAADEKEALDPQLALQRALADLKAWRSSFSTLRVKYRWSNPGQLMARFPELKGNEERLSTWYHEVEWSWTDRGLSRQTALDFEDGRLVKRELNGLNKRLGFTAKYVGDAKFPKELVAAPNGPGSNRPTESCEPLYFLHWPDNVWLPERIARGSPVDVQVREIDGSPCVGFRMKPDAPNVTWLDLKHGGLLRRAESDIGMNWHCTEFRRTKAGLWFPHKGTFHFVDEPDQPYWFEVLEVGVNEPMPDSAFEPPPFDDNTVVVDLTHGMLRKPKPRAATSSVPPKPPAAPVDPHRINTAAPRRNTWLWQTGLAVSAALLICGLAWRRCRS